MTMLQLHNLYILFGCLFATAGVLLHRDLVKTKLVTLPLYFTINTLLNIYGDHLRTTGTSSAVFMNLLTIPMEMYYFIWLFYHFISSKALKTTAIVLALLYSVLFITDVLFNQHEYPYLFVRSYTMGTFSLVILSIACLFEVMNSERLINFYRFPEFWICTGILLFYLVTYPFHLHWNKITVNFLNVFYNKRIYFYLFMYLAYSCFLMALICVKWKKR
jgi:hypothetical protein